MADEDFEGLTEDDLNQLASELDDTSLRTPVKRVSTSTSRQSTGTYDPNKLQAYLKEQAANTPDVKDKVPYGSSPVRTPSKYSSSTSSSSSATSSPSTTSSSTSKVAAKPTSSRKLDDDDELLAAITGQSEEELLKMVTEMEREEEKSRGRTILTASAPSPSASVVRATPVDKPRDDGVNSVDLADALKRLQQNDPTLTSLNLNNHPEMNVDYALAFAKALMGNTHLVDLKMANAKVSDVVAAELVAALKGNSTLQTINLETNEMTGKTLKHLISAIVGNKTLIELKLTNQSHSIGDAYEMDIARLIADNDTIRKLTLSTRSVAARNSIEKVCSRNSEAARKRRAAEKK